MSDLDPDRFTLRQADAVREAYAQVMEELDLIKEQLARLPTRRDQEGPEVSGLFAGERWIRPAGTA